MRSLFTSKFRAAVLLGLAAGCFRSPRFLLFRFAYVQAEKFQLAPDEVFYVRGHPFFADRLVYFHHAEDRTFSHQAVRVVYGLKFHTIFILMIEISTQFHSNNSL